MKPYPSIPHFNDSFLGRECFAFLKYDGSNLRFTFDVNKGWYQSGTRTRLFDASDKEFGEAFRLLEPLKPALEVKVVSLGRGITFYFEFLGPHSFAGAHSVEALKDFGINVEHNDPKRLVLLDVNAYKKGFLSPGEFLSLFGDEEWCAEWVYSGFLTEKYVQSVREYGVGEGIVVKGGSKHGLWRCKVKTISYLEKLKKAAGDKWETYA